MRYETVYRSPLLLTVPDTARRLHRHEQTVRAMIRRGDLAAVRLGRLVRVLAAAVDGLSRPPMAPVTIQPRSSRRSPRLVARA
jgi:excisionase family DNA binding protein